MIQDPNKPVQAVKRLISLLTPTNLSHEKALFFESHQYNPQLTYTWDDPAVFQQTLTHAPFRPLFEALHTQDAALVSDVAGQLFDTRIDAAVLSAAQQIVTTAPERLPTPSIESITTSFQHAFDRLGLSEYSLEVVDQHGFNFRPSGSNKKIVMSKHLSLDFFSVESGIRHELTHILRYENGVFNHIPAAVNYLPIEEGLACYCQDFSNIQAAFQHAAEYTMTEVCLHHSFREVIDYLQDLGFSKELAWQRAIRHKYGFRDTSLPGDIMKPSMYFFQEQKVNRLTKDEIYRLFVGKITLDQLSDFPVYQGRIPFDLLQSFYGI